MHRETSLASPCAARRRKNQGREARARICRNKGRGRLALAGGIEGQPHAGVDCEARLVWAGVLPSGPAGTRGHSSVLFPSERKVAPDPGIWTYTPTLPRISSSVVWWIKGGQNSVSVSLAVFWTESKQAERSQISTVSGASTKSSDD